MGIPYIVDVNLVEIGSAVSRMWTYKLKMLYR